MSPDRIDVVQDEGRLVDPAELVIAGIPADSTNEANTAWALTELNWKFDYQTVLRGDGSRLGDIRVDFIVRTAPMATPLFVDGEYWHSGQQSEEDRGKRAFIDAYYKGVYFSHKVLYSADTNTKEAALASVTAMFGVNNA